MLEEFISAYQDDAGWMFQGLSCSCSTAGCGYWDYFILPCCTTLLSHQKTSIFLPQHCCKNRTKTSYITCATTSQANKWEWASQSSHGRCNLAWIMNNHTILFESASSPPPEVDWMWCAFDVHRISSGFMWTRQTGLDAHSMHIMVSMWMGL